MSDLSISPQSNELRDERLPRRRPSEDSQVGDVSDLWKILARHPLVLLVCAVVSVAIGALYYVKIPPQFESTADILFERTQAPAFSPESMLEQRMERQKHIATHTYSLTSPIIIQKALAGMRFPESLQDSENPMEEIVDSLTVEVFAKDSDVLTLRCTRPDRTEAFDLISAIIESYEVFLGEMSRDVGEETAELILNAKDDLELQLQSREEQYRSFQKTAPIVWQDGKGVNTHHLRQIQVEEARSKLAIERAELISKLDGITTTLAVPSGRKALFFEAMKELAELERNSSYGGAPEQVVDREQARLLTEQLMQLANTEARLEEDFGDGHPEVAAVRKRIRTIRNQLSNTNSQLASVSVANSPSKVNEYVTAYVTMLSNRLGQVDTQLAELKRIVVSEQVLAGEMQAFVAQDESLQQEVARTQELFDAVVARLEEINIVRDHSDERMQVMAPPQLGEQVSPTLLKAAALSMVLFGLSGCGLTYLLDITEGSYRSPDEIRKSLQSPIIGMIPHWNSPMQSEHDGKGALAPSLVAYHRNESNVAEAFRAIRTSLLFSSGSGRQQVIQVTSPLPSDGKSTLASNLSITLAQAGKRVLLIDADFRRPSLHTLFGRPRQSAYGLVEVISSECDPLADDMATEVENLFVMSCGKRPGNPSEVLSSPEFEATLEMLRDQYDFIILDTPPVLAVTDPIAVAARVDSVVLAIRVRRGCRLAAERAGEVLNEVNANILGIVVNAIDSKSTFGGYKRSRGYGYGYGYHSYASEQYREDPISERAAIESS